ALAALSPADRELLLLSAWVGLAPREIARVLGVPAPVVSARLYRARRRLAAGLTLSGEPACSSTTRSPRTTPPRTPPAPPRGPSCGCARKTRRPAHGAAASRPSPCPPPRSPRCSSPPPTATPRSPPCARPPHTPPPRPPATSSGTWRTGPQPSTRTSASTAP